MNPERPFSGVAINLLRNVGVPKEIKSVNDYMTKPVNRDLLMQKMKRYNDSILKIS